MNYTVEEKRSLYERGFEREAEIALRTRSKSPELVVWIVKDGEKSH